MNYILSSITGNWAHFQQESPSEPGYPLHWTEAVARERSERLGIKVGFSGTWGRLGKGYLERPDDRAFTKGRDGEAELWLEGKEWTGGPCDLTHNPIRIHAGCPLKDFVSLIRQGGGEVYLDEATRKLLQPRLYQVEEGILPPDNLEALESGRPVALLEFK